MQTTDRKGAIIRVGDLVEFVNADSPEHGDTGRITEIFSDGHIKALWTKTEREQCAYNFYVKLLESATPVEFTVDSAVEFLISKGFKVQLSK